ncbi:MAG: phosphoheptose isomerase [Bacteroidetes bacterium RIFCSPLOWO2_12_FULL_31_6]|nr:MAG: phosphoheptose isomerase [Bacteroidetes bacterium RIFCSPLOWO2_12_FULL_31_6]
MDFEETIKQNIQASLNTKQALLNDANLLEQIKTISEKIITTYKNDGKVLFCGNGGSAADAQHLAAEFSGRYYFDRPPLFAEALHVNTSYLTAVANDYSYEETYSRIVKAMGRKGDILIGISTSGNSKNVLKALQVAKEVGMITVAFTGKSGGEMKNCCDYLINIPSTDTPRIQECHILVGHIICEIVESSLFVKPA